MRKLLVGIVAVVSAAGGVAACGGAEKTKAKTTPVAQTEAVPVPNVQTTVEVKPTATSDPSATSGSHPGAPETKAPRFTLVLSDGKSGFKFRSTMLSEEAKAKIDELFTGEKIDLNNARFEIEGYTDNLGSPELNHQVGLARAEAVRQYLGEQHEIHKDCISVVSYGMENPVADNSTPEGRARNRRVVIKILE